MKDLHTVLGLSVSFGSARCICTYCIMQRSQMKGEMLENRLDPAEKRTWSLYDRLSVSERKALGFVRPPLMRCFQFADVLPEPLHLFLRIMDKLLANLLNTVRRSSRFLRVAMHLSIRVTCVNQLHSTLLAKVYTALMVSSW